MPSVNPFLWKVINFDTTIGIAQESSLSLANGEGGNGKEESPARYIEVRDHDGLHQHGKQRVHNAPQCIIARRQGINLDPKF